MRVFLVGLPGSGKSTVGKHLATHFNAGFFDLDEVIKERAGADIPWIFDVEGETGFRDREESAVADSLGTMMSWWRPAEVSYCVKRIVQR